MATREEMILKIKKIMATANDTSEGGEHERETAMAMVQKLLIKHRIDLSEINETDDNTTQDFLYENISPAFRRIARAIANMNFCKYIYSVNPKRPSYGNHQFIGSDIDVQACIALAKHLILSVRREARQGAKLYPHDKSYTRSFENAASCRIRDRAKENVANAIEQEKNISSDQLGTSLVITTAYEKIDEIATAYLEKTKQSVTLVAPRAIKINSSQGYKDGVEYGNKVEIT